MKPMAPPPLPAFIPPPPPPDQFANLLGSPPFPGQDPFANMDGLLPPPPNNYPPSESESETEDEDENELESGMVPTLKHLYRNWDRKQWRSCRNDENKKLFVKKNKHERFAVVVRRERDMEGELGLFNFTIQSPLLRDLLEECMDGYPGFSTKMKDLTFTKPFYEFVYRWDKYEQCVKECVDETTLQHVSLLNEVLELDIIPLVLHKKELESQNLASFRFVWAHFEPGCEVWTQILGEDRILIVESCTYQGSNAAVSLALNCKAVDYDGRKFGWVPVYLTIDSFDGYKAITDLDAVPLRLHPDREELIERLTARGRVFESLQGLHFKSYTGKLSPNEHGKRSQDVTNTRVVVDAEMYHARSDDPSSLRPFDNDCGMSMPPPPPRPTKKKIKGKGKAISGYGAYSLKELERDLPTKRNTLETKPEEEEDPPELQEHHYRLCTPLVKGHCLKTKLWVKMSVVGIRENIWNEATFKRLFLPNSYKELILSLVESHLSADNKFDDIVDKKGKGMVVLLSGDPGLGKTLTAEAVAEKMRRPLFAMSAGQLGHRTEDVEEDLNDILEICAKWEAVLLLDEADVFLEKREVSQLSRNKLVSVFLRLLEYYEGAMFLTTNRATSLDPAIKSRLDMHIDYPKLDQEARAYIWKTFVWPSEDFPHNTSLITDDELTILSKLDINGREIKNLVKTGRLLAKRKEEELSMVHLKTVLSVQTNVPML